MVVHFPLWVKIMPDFGDVRALSAAIAPDAAGVIIGQPLIAQLVEQRTVDVNFKNIIIIKDITTSKLL